MIFRILLRYLLGYVSISVEGYYIERFINICISKSILIWNVRRDKSTYMRANVGVKDYKKLKEVSKKTKCKIKIKNRRGLPFLLNRYRKRKIFGVLLAFVIILMFSTSRFVWNIEIEGNERIKKEELIDELKENGLYVGALKNKLDVQGITNKVRLSREDIAWMSIDLKGTNVIVKIAETTQKPEIINQDEYCNIVSNKNAQITKITANTGTILVNVRRLSYRKHNTNWRMDGRKIHRNKICACKSGMLRQKFGIVKRRKCPLIQYP